MHANNCTPCGLYSQILLREIAPISKGRAGIEILHFTVSVTVASAFWRYLGYLHFKFARIADDDDAPIKVLLVLVYRSSGATQFINLAEMGF